MHMHQPYYHRETHKRVIRLDGVMNKTGLGRSVIYMHMKAGTFPQSIKLGARAVGWLESDIDDWIDQRIAETPQAV